MAITKELFGAVGGQSVEAYTLTNQNGLSAKLITYGARLVNMLVPDKTGANADVVLGFDDLESYVATDHYFGATCGRYGNRIKDGRFELDGEIVAVTRNEDGNHIHGGLKGFDKHIWVAYPDDAKNAVTFTHVSKANDEGFPGELVVRATYTLTDDNQLDIVMAGISDATTILNMVHHSYWNMAGHDSGGLHKQILRVESDFYTPVEAGLLATGEILRVEGTPFDFRKEKTIGQDLLAVPNAGVAHLSGGGYDHNWILRGFGSGLRPVATLWDKVSGRGMSLRSTEPGVHIYTGGYISEKIVGKGNKPYEPYSGLTFETQKFPGAPNFSHFESTRLAAGEPYNHVMQIQFFIS